MRILAIETSCDETAISILKKTGRTFTVLSNIVSSQAALHASFGGVVPNLARNEHEKNLVPIAIAALKEAGMYKERAQRASGSSVRRCIGALDREPILRIHFEKMVAVSKPPIDAIAVTSGPGLEPALWVGINFAKALACLWGKPLIPVNHMEGHIYSALIAQKKTRDKNGMAGRASTRSARGRFTLNVLRHPTIALLVSGGHTEIVLTRPSGRYRIVGETLDDAAGEAFDKVAQMLGLGYPGGPAISKIAKRGDPRAIAFPRPMINAQNLNVSFSGLKTAVLYYLRDTTLHVTSDTLKADVAASFQRAVVDVLVAKTFRALQTYCAQTLILGGGVAANTLLRTEMRRACKKNIRVLLPDRKLTGDNALMIALAAFFGKKKSARAIRADGNLRLG